MKGMMMIMKGMTVRMMRGSIQTRGRGWRCRGCSNALAGRSHRSVTAVNIDIVGAIVVAGIIIGMATARSQHGAYFFQGSGRNAKKSAAPQRRQENVSFITRLIVGVIIVVLWNMGTTNTNHD
jgi:hypothetical protein